MKKRAVILAGGKGTRLRPYTVVLPKPLMPIGEYPILEVVIRQLVFHGFEHITMAVNHQAEIIKAFFGDGSKWGVQIDYSLEDQPLGTIGPLRLIQGLPQHFLVMNGDVLTDLNFSEFYAAHVSHSRLFTVSSHIRRERIDYGVLEADADGRLQRFEEKPTKIFEVSMGIYMINSDLFNLVPEGRAYGFDQLMHDMLRTKQPVAVKKFEGYWLDIGRPDDYMQAIEEFKDMKQKFLHG
jgi:NDP-mannose synthase